MRSKIQHLSFFVGVPFFCFFNAAVAQMDQKPVTGLVKEAELQWSVCESPEVTIKKLADGTPKYSKMQQLFLDDPNLYFFKNNHLMRVRENEKEFATTLKINFHSESEIPQEFHESSSVKCEWDYYANGQKIGCKVQNQGRDGDAYLNQEQLSLVKAISSNKQLDQIKIYGPFLYEKWKFKDKSFKKMTVDSVQTRQGEKLVDISVRVPASDRELEFKKWTQFFKQKKINICSTPKKRTEQLLF